MSQREDIERLIELSRLGDAKALLDLMRLLKRGNMPAARDGQILNKIVSMFRESIDSLESSLEIFRRTKDDFFEQLLTADFNRYEEESKDEEGPEDYDPDYNP